MKIRLLCVGAIRSVPLRALCEDYAGRLKRYVNLEVHECRQAAGGQPQAVAEESARLRAALDAGDHVWVLDQRGQQVTSPQLAKRLQLLENRSVKRLAILLGGAYGLSDDLRSSGEQMSLSPLTFPHELCRAIALEQLYRAYTILRGEPYHH